MKHTKNTTPKNTLLKGIGKTAVVAGLGLGLLIPGSSLARFTATEAMPGTKITTGAFAMKPSSLNLQSAGWTLDGVAVPADKLSNILIEPGQKLEMTAVTKAAMREGTLGTIYLNGYPDLETLVSADPAFSISASYDGKQSSSKIRHLNGDYGMSYDKLVDQNLADVAKTTKVTITMKPLSNTVYDDLSVGRQKTFDVSKLALQLSTSF